MRPQPLRVTARKPLRLDDEVHFIRSLFERPLATGALTPSGRILARTMARYVEPALSGPVVELGPGTGPVTEALVEHGVDPARLILVEFNPRFCALLRARFPTATVLQGDAYRLRDMPAGLLRESLALLRPSAPFVQFTYAVVPPIPKTASGVHVEASERIWMNLPPARVWVYRKG